MKIFKKVITGITITATILTAIYLILMLFSVKILENYTLQILLTIGGLAVGGFFALTSLNVVNKNKILGYMSLSVILISFLLADIMAWTGLSTLLKITVSLGLLAIIFNIIVSANLEYGKRFLVSQIALYILTITLYIIFTLNLFSVFPKGNGIGLKLFIALTIIDIMGLIILKILYKKQQTTLDQKDMVTISKSEYELLKQKADKYDQMHK